MNNLTKKLLLAGASLSLVGSLACEDNKQSKPKMCTDLELYDGGQLIKSYDNVTNLDSDFRSTRLNFKDKEGLTHRWAGTYLTTDSPCK